MEHRKQLLLTGQTFVELAREQELNQVHHHLNVEAVEVLVSKLSDKVLSLFNKFVVIVTVWDKLSEIRACKFIKVSYIIGLVRGKVLLIQVQRRPSISLKE